LSPGGGNNLLITYSPLRYLVICCTSRLHICNLAGLCTLYTCYLCIQQPGSGVKCCTEFSLGLSCLTCVTCPASCYRYKCSNGQQRQPVGVSSHYGIKCSLCRYSRI